MALLMVGATAFFVMAMPVALGVAVQALVAGGTALVAGGLTWSAISFADNAAPRPRTGSVVEEELSIQLRGEEYSELPGWRPIFASEIGSPDAAEPPPVLELTDVVAGPAPSEPLSIAALMMRLEAGIERRAVEAKPVVQTPAALVPPNMSGDFGALRNVLDELQRMAVR
jgi:hypothetical protein